MILDFPSNWIDLLRDGAEVSGHVFNNKESIPPTKFTVLKLRWGSGQIANLKTMTVRHPTIQLLLKNDTMKTARWSKSFPCREIVLNEKL